MAVIRYCWRCDMDIPMLDEAEWGEIEPLLKQGFKEVMAYVAEHHCPLDEAWAKFNSGACQSYFLMTGFAETNHDAL